MKKGVSVTDACINFDTTVELLGMMNYMKVCEANTIGEIRKLIREYDQLIHSFLHEDNLVVKNKLINSIVLTKYMMHEDKETASFCKGKLNEEELIMMTGLRFALSERVAEIKVKTNPFDYIYNGNDFLSLITKRDVEKENLKLFQDPFYLKIMEVSKNIQVRYLEKFVADIKIGYLFGKGTFSHEVITENLRGQHIAYKNYGELKAALENKSIDFMILPTYNSIIGEIFELESYWQVHGSIDHKIELCLYGNVKDIKDSGVKIDVLYLKYHIEKEC